MTIISTKATNIELTEAIKNYLEEKLARVGKMTVDYDPVAKMAVEVGKSTEHHHKGPFFFCELTLEIPGDKLLLARDEKEDLYAAIDAAEDQLRRQLVERKERMVESHRHARPDKE